MGIFRQFPYTNFHDLNLDWLIGQMKDVLKAWAEYQEKLDILYEDITTAFDSFKAEFDSHIASYDAEFRAFMDSIDVNVELRKVFDEAIADGTIPNIINPVIAQKTAEWLDANITEPVGVVIDKSLRVDGACADAKATGDWVRGILFRKINAVNSAMFEKGNLDAYGEKDEYKADSRIRSVICSSDNDIIIDARGTSKGIIFFFNGDGSFDFKSNWTDHIFIKRGRIFKLLLTLNPDDSEVRTIDAILNGFDIYTDSYYTDSVSKENFVHGTLSASGDTDYQYAKRAISSSIQRNSYDVAVKPLRGAKYLIAYYNDDGSWAGASSWFTSAQVIPAGTNYRLMLTVDDTNIYPVSTILNYFIIEESKNKDYNIEIITGDIAASFETGSLLRGADDSFNGDARARSTTICRSKNDIVVKSIKGAHSVHFFDDTGAFTHETGWKYRDTYIPADSNFRILCTPNINASNYYSVEECLECIKIENIDNYAMSLNPNIIYQCRNVDETQFPPYSKYYIQAAARNQYDRVRVNVRITTDGKFVLIHNNTINSEARNPDGTPLSSEITSDGQTFATLNSYDWGIKYGSRYAGMGVPVLEDACKYASLYNMGLSIETSFTPTDAQIEEMFKIISKYGCVENLIIITASGYGFAQLEKWNSLSEYISIYIGGEPTIFTRYESDINHLKTDKNEIWCQLYPWGTVPTAEFRALCNANGWRLYNSTVMNKNELFNVVGYDKGLTLIEATNIYNIKNTVRDYADDQI